MIINYNLNVGKLCSQTQDNNIQFNYFYFIFFTVQVQDNMLITGQ